MKNVERWQPSKYALDGGRLRASRDAREVGIASRLVTDTVATLYAEWVPRCVRGRLIDLGCGKVPLYATYHPYVDEVVCVDWENSLHKNPHLDREVNLNEPLPFADGEFDSIILSDVLEHVAAPESLFREMTRILSPGGRILLNVPFLYGIHEEPHDYYRYTEHALRRFVETSGLRLLSLETLGGSLEVAADITAKHLQRLPVVGGPLAQLVQGCVALFRQTRAGRMLSARSAKAFPLGYFVVAEKGGGG
jgi:SAM-dependent methyltransferase